LGNALVSAASKCYGAVAFTNNSIEIQGRAGACVKLTWPDFTKKLQILGFDTAGGNSWL
jgi:hypothetical protein